MLKVIKRSGKEEDFRIEKIMHTLAAASDELKKPLSESDVKNIAEDTKKRIEEKEKITSKELYDTLVDTMRRDGYAELAAAYVGSSNNFWA